MKIKASLLGISLKPKAPFVYKELLLTQYLPDRSLRLGQVKVRWFTYDHQRIAERIPGVSHSL